MSTDLFKDLDILLKEPQSLKIDARGKPTSFDTKVATTVLFLHMANADKFVDIREIQTIIKGLIKQFEVTEKVVGSLVCTAELLVAAPNRLPELLTIINTNFNDDQKITIISELVRIMHADGIVATIEAELGNYIAKVLHLNDKQVKKGIELAVIR